jgi:hypothetical protein
MGFYEQYYLQKSADRILLKLEKVDNAVEGRQWGKIKASLEAVKSEWKRTQKTWTLFLNHVEIDEINMSVAKSAGFAESRNRSMLMAEIITMKELISHIPDMEKVQLKNIF